MKEFWNERYGQEAYVYGEEPNEFFKESLTKYTKTPGRILMPAEGEGRNAVFAAALGWDVLAFDISDAGKTKADQLARKRGVSIDYQVVSFEEMHFEPNSMDAIGLIFAHFHKSDRSEYYGKMLQALKPGGLVIMEVFSKKHLEFNSVNTKAGGPKDLDLLFSAEEVQKDFSELNIRPLEEVEIDLSEGLFHDGKSAVIRFIGQKP